MYNKVVQMFETIIIRKHAYIVYVEFLNNHANDLFIDSYFS